MSCNIGPILAKYASDVPRIEDYTDHLSEEGKHDLHCLTMACSFMSDDTSRICILNIWLARQYGPISSEWKSVVALVDTFDEGKHAYDIVERLCTRMANTPPVDDITALMDYMGDDTSRRNLRRLLSKPKANMAAKTALTITETKEPPKTMSTNNGAMGVSTAELNKIASAMTGAKVTFSCGTNNGAMGLVAIAKS